MFKSITVTVFQLQLHVHYAGPPVYSKRLSSICYLYDVLLNWNIFYMIEIDV